MQDRSVVEAGLLLVPLGVGCAIAARFNARILARIGPRVAVAGGTAAMGASIALFMLLAEDTTPAVVLVGTFLVGFLLTVAAPPATAVIMDDLGAEKAGDGGAVNQLARQAGGAIGVALVGTIFAAIYTSRIGDVSGLSARGRARAAESIEEARDVIAGARPAAQDQLTASIDAAFDAAAHAGFALCAVVLLAAGAFAAFTLTSLPARDRVPPDSGV